jgi:pyruvate kinase
MKSTDIAPRVASRNFKRAKIIATVGPATNSYELILDLIKSGANGLRLNFSHDTHDERKQHIEWIRQASNEYGKPVAIIQDLQGPKMRLGDFDGMFTIAKGQSVLLRYEADYDKEKILPTQYDISQKVKRGERIYLYDGKVCLEVQSVKDGVVHTRAQNDGVLLSRKGINLPDTDFSGDILTDKDKKDIAFGVDNDVDYVALSFVQTADDIKNFRKHLKNLGSEAKIIAKIETKLAAENLEEIINEADGAMVARGDLAIEVSIESVPILQRKIIKLGLKYSKPSIVATQMLASMAEKTEATRAEVSDVVTAVLLGADAVMLSDETATGKHPIETVRTMKKVIKYAEENAVLTSLYNIDDAETHSKQCSISRAIITLADSIGACAIVAETKSGATALNIASKRPKQPLMAITSNRQVAQQLAIVYGCKGFIRKDELMQYRKLTDWLRLHRVLKKDDIIVSASGQHPGVVGTTDTIKVRVLE